MKGYLVDVSTPSVGVVEIEGNSHLDRFYELIGCRCIDICVRTIGGKQYNIVLDDEGLLVDSPVFSAFEPQGTPMLAGNLVILGMEEGSCELASLTDEDVSRIRKSMTLAIDTGRMNVYPVVIAEY